MKARLSYVGIILAALVLAACFAGCASEKTLYSWGQYEYQLYSFFKGESRETLIMTMESDQSTIENSGEALPPGFYAHMGMLYLENGNATGAAACFEREKALFPEAAAFMDFLLKGMGR